ncbi:MAG: nuclear transport factor 2 family protein [Hydrogenophilales bacterium]|jgi:ketosteroid isomerase-like protein|nr:nuclear transport factor 2 family protein [Hydrogenophilales bacterium]
MVKKIMLFGLVICTSMASLAEEPDHAIHKELRAVLKVVESAINSGDYDKMLPVVSEEIRATPVNQEFLSSRAEVSAYFKKWFGAGGYLKKLEISFTPDTLTELSPDKTWGVVYGNGIERYILSDGRPYDLQTRWTATMVKEADGHWRIRAIHIATNFLDNPILTEAEHALGKAAAAGGVLGLLVGGALGWWLRRKKKS